MGVTIFYQAIPEQSALFARLNNNLADYLLFAEFFDRGSGPFCLSVIEPEEMAEVLEHLAQSPTGRPVFGSRAGGEQALASLEAELERTKDLFPGIEYRTAMLEKIDQELYEQLAPFFQAAGGENALALLLEILDGNEQSFTPAGIADGEARLWLVSASRVRQAAQLLQALTPERVFAEADAATRDWLLEDYDSWRNAYLQAAQENEAMIVGLG